MEKHKNQKEDEMVTTTITLKRDTRRRLQMWKYALDCKNIDEVLDRIMKIIPASEMEKFKK